MFHSPSMQQMLNKASERDKLLARLMNIRHSSLCDPECHGRCRECPADVVQDAIAFIEATPHTMGQQLGTEG